MKKFTLLFSFFFISSCTGQGETSFQKANRLVNGKEYKKAIPHFENHFEETKNSEERWFSKYMLGECFENLGSWKEASQCYLDAFEINSKKTEPLLKLATHYRKTGENDLSYLFAKQGSLIAQNQGDSLKDKFDEELSIVSYYTQFPQDGFHAANNLLLRKGISWSAKDLATRNILYYVQNLPFTRFVKIEVKLPFIEHGGDELYRPMNASINKTNSGYKVLCRAVNYHQVGGWDYISLASDGVIRTRNFMIDFTEDLIPISQIEVDDAFGEHPTSVIQGREDCRLFSYRGSSWFTYTDPIRSSEVIDYKIALCKLGRDLREGKIVPEKTLRLLGPDPTRFEKNWLPFEKDGKIYLVYSSDPLMILSPDLKTGNCVSVVDYSPKGDFSRFRGSASPIRFQDGYLLMIHEVAFFDEKRRRVYTHRFVYLDSDFRIKKVSKPFTFKEQGIEFCCGMTLSHSEKDLVMTVGVEDEEAYFVFFPVEQVSKLLEDYE